MNRFFIISFLFKSLFFFAVNCSAQDSSWHKKPELKISGFADVFYVYDFNQPLSIERQPFLFNHNRHNEFNVNLAFVKLGLDHEKFRANLALQTGTYANDNYSAEPGLLKSAFEANIGISLNKKNNLWLDAGIIPSHIGFESAISSDNWTMTRSILAENSPYFLSGAKLTYNPYDKLEIAGLILNGWQRIQRLPGNSLPSFGSQVKYSHAKNITLNWSTFIGTNDPDTTRRMRYFNNFYGQFQLTEKFGIIAGFDLGTQQRIKRSTSYDVWFSPVVIGQLIFNKSWKTAFRAEYYQDPTGIMIANLSPIGFRTTGFSLNLDFSPTPNIMCRLEGRSLISKDNIFQKMGTLSNKNFILSSTLLINFSEMLKRN
jgi:hypothetical protein